MAKTIRSKNKESSYLGVLASETTVLSAGKGWLFHLSTNARGYLRLQIAYEISAKTNELLQIFDKTIGFQPKEVRDFRSYLSRGAIHLCK